jgi:serine/threonine-protein kinase
MASRERVGPYELCEEIAVGGMAGVHLARKRTPEGKMVVALKRLRRDLATQRGQVELFHDEARLGLRLVHPNVCRVFEGGTYEDEHYITMEWVLGETAEALLRSPRWLRADAAELAARVVADAATGLDAAHELLDAEGAPLGIVHADVCPENVMVTYEGEVKVIDFGIAQHAGSARAEGLRGRVAYMAPEQIEQHPFDRRADVWALGVTLWELLTGERLFARSGEPATMYAVMQAPIRPPSSVSGGPPHGLDDIVMRALQRAPADRFATARELVRALEPFAGSSQLLSRWMREAFHQRIAEQNERLRRAATVA